MASSTATKPPLNPPRGRPRDANRHAAILAATRAILLESGYGKVTFDAVAQRASVSRVTVHKWWGHRAQLVEEALFEGLIEERAPDTGSFAGDLEALVAAMVRRLTDPLLVRGMAPLRAELNANPHLVRETTSRFIEPTIRRWQVVFDRAVRSGELSEGSDPIAAMLTVLGATEALSQHRPTVVPRRKLVPYLVDLLLGGIATTAQRPTRQRGGKR